MREQNILESVPLDGVNVIDESSIRLNGWVVDRLNQGFGIEPVVLGV